MENNKEGWKEEVLESMIGSQKAQPRPELFHLIQQEIYSTPIPIDPLFQWKKYVAAAAFILLMNISALFYYSQNRVGVSHNNIAAIDDYQQSFITSFQIYK